MFTTTIFVTTLFNNDVILFCHVLAISPSINNDIIDYLAIYAVNIT